MPTCSALQVERVLLGFKNPAAPAVKREAEEDWNRRRRVRSIESVDPLADLVRCVAGENGIGD